MTRSNNSTRDQSVALPTHGSVVLFVVLKQRDLSELRAPSITPPCVTEPTWRRSVRLWSGRSRVRIPSLTLVGKPDGVLAGSRGSTVVLKCSPERVPTQLNLGRSSSKTRHRRFRGVHCERVGASGLNIAYPCGWARGCASNAPRLGNARSTESREKRHPRDLRRVSRNDANCRARRKRTRDCSLGSASERWPQATPTPSTLA